MGGIASTPVRELRGVGPALAAKLADCGVHRVEDLLFHLPLRYQDRTRVTPIGALLVKCVRQHQWLLLPFGINNRYAFVLHPHRKIQHRLYSVWHV